MLLNYTLTMRYLVATFALICSFCVAAIEPPTEEELAGAEEVPLDLGNVDVIGHQFTFEQELAFRLVRQALQTPRSSKEENRDVWVCWIDQATGSHFNYLNCARNGDLWALKPSRASLTQRNTFAPGNPGRGNGFRAGNVFIPANPRAGYGAIMRSTRPVMKAKLNKMLATMHGSDELDREFVSMALAGQTPPRDIPSEDELDRFALAYRAVGEMAGANDDMLEGAIAAQGLALARYNRIVDLISTYQSIENEVAIRLNAMAESGD